MPKPIPDSINLLTPVNAPEDIWEKLYDWLFNVGKYILITVVVAVLAVFFSRFILDRKSNDLTDEVNIQVDTLTSPFYRNAELKYRNYNILFSDINAISANQDINSLYISSVIESIPSNLTLERFSFTDGQVTLFFTASDLESLQSYEASVKSKPLLYEGVKATLSASEDSSSQFEFSISYTLKKPEDAPIVPAIDPNSLIR